MLLRNVGVVIVCASFMVTGAAAAAETSLREQVLVVSDGGEVAFSEAVECGDVLVPPGRYHLAERVEGLRHVIVLRRLSNGDGGAIEHELTMTTVAARQVANRSAVFIEGTADGRWRIAAIQIAGENVDHLSRPPRLA